MVITIIGLLSAVVMGSLQINREKAANAAIKQNLTTLRSEVELFYTNSTTSSYVNVCDDAKILRIRTAVNSASGLTMACYSNANTWAASSALKRPEGANNYWCVDGGGASRGHASPLGANITVCPAN